MLSRRQLIQSSAAFAVAGAAASTAALRPRSFVLVHGTWHGGWVWRDVRQLLQADGHRVFTPTCTGCGEREHLSNPDVGLATHVADISSVIEFEELNDIVLVGHSFSGLTITGIADRFPDRIRKVVFFDALVPREGRMSGVPRDPESGAFPDWWNERVTRFIDGYKMDFWSEYPVEMLVPANEHRHVERLRRLITTHPAKQWTDELVLEGEGWHKLPRAYVHCIGQSFRRSSEQMIGPARGKGWEFVEIDTPRNAMMTHPDLVARLLGDLAA